MSKSLVLWGVTLLILTIHLTKGEDEECDDADYLALSPLERVISCSKPQCWGCDEYRAIPTNYGEYIKGALHCMQ